MNDRPGKSPQDSLIAEVDRLVAALGRGELEGDEADRLEFLLRTNPLARDRYIQSSVLIGALEWDRIGAELLQSTVDELGPGDGKSTGTGSGAVVNPPLLGTPLDATQADVKDLPLGHGPTHFDQPPSTLRFSTAERNGSQNGHGSIFPAPSPTEMVTVRFIDRVRQAIKVFAHPLPAAAAILALGAGALALSVLSRPGDPLAGSSATGDPIHESAPSVATVGANTKTVARLTNSWDATWVDWAARPKDGATLMIGQRLDLVGGLVELTFDCGAVAILQAPASFILRADNGGTLETGRLTARVSGPITKFWVETPTMKVIDWGTEFGVSAEPSGASRVHVFAGKVEVAPASAPRAAKTDLPANDRSLFLYAGQGGRVEPHGAFSDRPTSTPASSTFVRTMPDNAIADYMRTLLASQPWGYWNFNSTVTATLVPDATGNGRFAQLMEGAMVVQGGTVLAVGPAVSLAGSSDWVLVPTGATLSLRRSFTFEALFRTTRDGAIIAKSPVDGVAAPGGKALYVEEGRPFFEAFGKDRFCASNQVDDGQWHHLVVTSEPSGVKAFDRTIMYVDGVERARRGGWSIGEVDDSGMPLKIGMGDRSTSSKSSFPGELDEVAVFDRCISAEEVESHYWAYLKSGMAVHGHQ